MNKKLFLGVMASVVVTVVQPTLAEKNQNDSTLNETICKEIFKYSDLNRKLSNNPKIYRNKKERQRIEDILHRVMLPFHWSEDIKASVFEGVDIDEDGKDDKIIRSCGSGTGRLCSLFITFSSDDSNNDDFETMPFWLGKIGKNTYLVEEVDGASSPYSDKDITRVYHITKDSIPSICLK